MIIRISQSDYESFNCAEKERSDLLPEAKVCEQVCHRDFPASSHPSENFVDPALKGPIWRFTRVRTFGAEFNAKCVNHRKNPLSHVELGRRGIVVTRNHAQMPCGRSMITNIVHAIATTHIVARSRSPSFGSCLFCENPACILHRAQMPDRNSSDQCISMSVVG